MVFLKNMQKRLGFGEKLAIMHGFAEREPESRRGG